MELTKVAFGGGCYWCTEAIFQSLIGVEKVAQGFISSKSKTRLLFGSSYCLFQ
jgi:peptide-methionine (S)-S-oxide reductase